MSKISLEEVESTLLRQKVDPKIVTNVIKELNEVIEEEKNDRVPTPKSKNEFLIILSDPNDELKGKEFAGYVVQMKQGDDAALVIDKIKAAATETNAAKKNKKGLITNMAEAFYSIKRAFIKPNNILIKTKEQVRVLVTNGKL